jgi:hypothetical protein
LTFETLKDGLSCASAAGADISQGAVRSAQANTRRQARTIIGLPIGVDIFYKMADMSSEILTLSPIA